MSDESRQVQIGDEQYTIARFRGLKAAEAGALVARVMEKTPELQDIDAGFREKYRIKHTVRITPAMARLEQFLPLGLTPEDFERAGGVIEFPDEPTPRQAMMALWPHVYRLAKQELQRFLGLLVISNLELEKADDEDSVEQALDAVGKRVLRAGYVEDLLELVIVGVDVFREQLRRKRDSLGELDIPWISRLLEEPLQEIPIPAEEPEEEMNRGPGETDENPMDPSPASSSEPVYSSDSVDDMDGVEETSSTESLGVS